MRVCWLSGVDASIGPLVGSSDACRLLCLRDERHNLRAEGEMAESDVKIFGRYIVADPRICHGQLTFRGTRVVVADVLAQVARGLPWEEIAREWRGTVPLEAIAEAVSLAARPCSNVRRSSLRPSPARRLQG